MPSDAPRRRRLLRHSLQRHRLTSSASSAPPRPSASPAPSKPSGPRWAGSAAVDDLMTRVDDLVVRAAALGDDPRRSALDVLGYLIDSTPTIDTLLRFAHGAAH